VFFLEEKCSFYFSLLLNIQKLQKETLPKKQKKLFKKNSWYFIWFLLPNHILGFIFLLKITVILGLHLDGIIMLKRVEIELKY